MILCRLDAFKATELPALLQAGTHARQLLLKGVGQSSQQRLDLCRANLELKQQQQQVYSESVIDFSTSPHHL